MNKIANSLTGAVRSLKKTRPDEDFPARVRDSIRRNDNRSELLVKLFQLIVFGSFGLFYAFSRKPESATFSQLPAVLSIYLAVTLVLLLYAAYRGLPDWLIYASIFVDVLLLTYLIWSFHLQYGQPAAFSLKAPEVFNYFLIIGLRAMRFQIRHVIAAGLASAFAWAFLVVYVVTSAMDGSEVTRDYVAYLTSNSVLIGAEVAKIISMLMFTVILALAVRRAHNFLVRAVSESTAADDLSRFFPDAVANQIRESDNDILPGEGARRDAAILNIDIRGFSSHVSELDPNSTVGLLSSYQHHIIPIIHKHGGLIDKFMGDGIMATFGASKPSPTYAADALRALDDILEELEHISEAELSGLAVNMAVAAGPVVFGAVGDENRLEFTVIGPSVNLSAKLEKHNKIMKSQALCDLPTWEAAQAQGYTRQEGPVVVHSQVADTSNETEIVVLA